MTQRNRISHDLALKGYNRRKKEGVGRIVSTRRAAENKCPVLIGQQVKSGDKKTGKKREKPEEQQKNSDETSRCTCHGIRETVKQVKPIHLILFHDLTLALTNG